MVNILSDKNLSSYKFTLHAMDGRKWPISIVMGHIDLTSVPNGLYIITMQQNYFIRNLLITKMN